jgi:hypothetical protein
MDDSAMREALATDRSLNRNSLNTAFGAAPGTLANAPCIRFSQGSGTKSMFSQMTLLRKSPPSILT